MKSKQLQQIAAVWISLSFWHLFLRWRSCRFALLIRNKRTLILHPSISMKMPTPCRKIFHRRGLFTTRSYTLDRKHEHHRESPHFFDACCCT
ncbi:unnamed protein product [Amoebophrya sp. A25]|nr:unnamed protein product [Amoebophrya sp. A25]|eukprot:GSA25T00009809001.1